MKLINKKQIKKQTCYDLSISNTKVFFANGILVHNTNASVVIPVINGVQGDYWCQSRERIITPNDDNAGFASFIFTVKPQILEIVNTIMHNISDDVRENIKTLDEYNICIFGEWCGGNIQGKVALNQLPKMFIIFGIKVGDYWFNYDELKAINYTKYNDSKIYSIYHFPIHKVVIDFNNPEAAQNIINDLTLEVEDECPIGKFFGVSGIGEGLVFSPECPEYNRPDFRFKSKGVKHQNSKVTTLNPIDMEKVNSVNECVDKYLTESRLEQGIDKLKEMGLVVDTKSTGEYLKWVVGDVIKEHGDEILMSGLIFKEVSPKLSNKARLWFFNYLNKLTFNN